MNQLWPYKDIVGSGIITGAKNWDMSTDSTEMSANDHVQNFLQIAANFRHIFGVQCANAPMFCVKALTFHILGLPPMPWWFGIVYYVGKYKKL